MMHWLKYLALGLGGILFAVAGFCIVPATQYLSGAFQGVSESNGADIVPVQELQVEISDATFQDLISGTITLEEFETAWVTADPSSSAALDSGLSVPPLPEKEEEKPSSSVAESAPSSSSAESIADIQVESTAGTDSVSSVPEPSAPTKTEPEKSTEAAYETEVKALIQQLYVVRARALNSLNGCIDSAKAEYKALPQEQQTQARKISICLSKAGQLYALQSSCDKEVSAIVSQMRNILQENGQSTALADQAMNTYQSQKNAMYSSLVSQLYG